MKGIIFIIIFLILAMYVYDYQYIDKFTDTTVNTTAINNAVRTIYNNDIDSITKLYTIGNNIQKSNYILGSTLGTLLVNNETNLKDKLTVTATANLNGATNLNNGLNIKGNGGILSLEGSAKIGSGSNSYLSLFPRTRAEGRKAYIGFFENESKDLKILNEDTGSIIIGNKTNPNAIIIDNNGNTNFNTNIISPNYPIIDIAYKRGIVDKKNMVISSLTTIISCEYTPKLNNSSIYITCSGDYYLGPYYNDRFKSHIFINNNRVCSKLQSFRNQASSGTRSGTLFPISYMHKVSNKNKLNIEIKAERTAGDDPITLYNNSFLLMIIEYNAIII